MYKNRFEHLYEVKRARIPEPDNVTMRLQRLEKPEPWPSDLLEEIYASIDQHALSRYPNFVPYYDAIAGFAGVPAERMVITSGIDESIKSLLTLCCDPGDRFAVTWPGYAMYDVYARIFGVEEVQIVPEPDRFMPAEELIDKVPADVRILFLPNPGQPVENYLDPDQVRIVAAYCRDNDILLAVDEAYYHFGSESALPLIDEFDNILILRTFSKAMGAAGLRIGYAMGSSTAIAPLNAFRMAGEASSLALHAAAKLIEHFDSHVKPSIDDVIAGREYLREALRQQGIPAYGRHNNTVLADLGDGTRANQVAEALKLRHIYIKSGFPPPLERYLLITCGSPSLMQAFHEAMTDVLEEIG